jgi:DNA-binding NarL/FixJ family response regulator
VTIRTVIADDHALVGAGLEAVLGEQSGGRFEVVGATTRASDVAALVVERSADLALIDLHMPPPGGVVAVREVCDARPETRVVAVSGSADFEVIAAALAAGAAAFLPKTLGPEGLVAPLTTVMEGGGVLPAPFVGVLARHWLSSGPMVERPDLDPEERRLVALVCQGHELAAIAEATHVSPSTVKRRLADLEARLGASSRLELAYLAGRLGLVS